MNRISPATLLNIDALEYRAKGYVVRVFDKNGIGDLVPVAFDRLADGSKFKLRYPPYSEISAEFEEITHPNKIPSLGDLLALANKKSASSDDLLAEQKRTNDLLKKLIASMNAPSQD